MSIKKFLLLIILSPLLALSQPQERDTITLEEAVVNSNKSPKLVTIKFGRGKASAVPSLIQNPEVTLLVEDIPIGYLKEFTIYFDLYRKIWNDNGGRIKVNKTEFEIILFDISDDGKLSQRLTDPILITLEQSSKNYIKKKIDLSPYNIYTDRFFVYIKRLSPLPCDECFLYLPALTSSQKKKWFYGDKDAIKINDDLSKQYSSMNYQLRTEVKVVTRNY